MRSATRTALATALAGPLLMVSLAGCGGSDTTRARTGTRVLRPMPAAQGSSLGPQAPATLRSGSLPQPGVTQRVDAGGARLSVTLRSVIDPLRGSGSELPAGTRAVGVVIQIRSSGPRLYDSSATGDVSLSVSGGVVTPVLATRGRCKTPLEDFDRYITAGEDRIGCIVFAVANDATLDAVRFSPHAHRLGRLTWAP